MLCNSCRVFDTEGPDLCFFDNGAPQRHVVQGAGEAFAENQYVLTRFIEGVSL